MFSNSQPVKTTLLAKEQETSVSQNRSNPVTQRNLEKLIQAAQEYRADVQEIQPSTDRRSRPKTKRVRSAAAISEFESNHSVAGFKPYLQEDASFTMEASGSNVKRRPDSGITLESSTDFLSEVGLPSSASSIVDSPPPAYVQDVQEEVERRGYGAREHTQLLDQAAKADFDQKLSRALNSVKHEREDVQKQIHHRLLQYKALRKSLYHVLGTYSYELLEKIRKRLWKLSEPKAYIDTKVRDELIEFEEQINNLFEILDIYVDSKKLALDITDRWKKVNDIHNEEDFKLILKELKEKLREFDIDKEERNLNATCALLEEHLHISSRYESTSGSFRKLRKACRNLQAEQAEVCKNPDFDSYHRVQAIYAKVAKMYDVLSAVKIKSTRSTKDESTVDQEDNSSYMELASPQSSTIRSSESSVEQAPEKIDSAVEEDIKEATTQHAKRSTSTIRTLPHKPSRAAVSRRPRAKSTLTQRIANWREHTFTNPIDELYTRFSNDIQSFLSDLRDLDYNGRYHTNTEKNKNLEKRLAALQKDMKVLSDGNKSAKLSKILEPVLTRLGMTWRTIKQFILNEDKVPTTTLVYLHKALSYSQARSTRSITTTSARKPFTREKRRHSVVEEQPLSSTLQKKEVAPKLDHAGSQHSQVRETLKAYGLDVQSSKSAVFKEHALQSICTRSYEGDGEWEDVTSSEKSHNPSVASTIRPNKAPKVRAEVRAATKIEKPIQRIEEGEWEDVTSSGNSYKPTYAESTIRSVKSDKTIEAHNKENREHDTHQSVAPDKRRHRHRSKRHVHQSYAPELLGSRVTIMKQNRFLFFKTGTTTIDMSSKDFAQLYDKEGGVLIPSNKVLRKL